MKRSLSFQLPAWIFAELDLASPRASDTAKMELVIQIARRNIDHGGGPFGAAVFERETGRVVAPGANFVVEQGSSLLHAEIVAIAFAQATVENYTLDIGSYELVTSSEPCVQCLGATYWSGVSRLVCGARLEQAQAVGFDEGPRSPSWKKELAERGVEVVDGVLADHAAGVLSLYRARGGLVYGARLTRH